MRCRISVVILLSLLLTQGCGGPNDYPTRKEVNDLADESRECFALMDARLTCIDDLLAGMNGRVDQELASLREHHSLLEKNTQELDTLLHDAILHPEDTVPSRYLQLVLDSTRRLRGELENKLSHVEDKSNRNSTSIAQLQGATSTIDQQLKTVGELVGDVKSSTESTLNLVSGVKETNTNIESQVKDFNQEQIRVSQLLGDIEKVVGSVLKSCQYLERYMPGYAIVILCLLAAIGGLVVVFGFFKYALSKRPMLKAKD